MPTQLISDSHIYYCPENVSAVCSQITINIIAINSPPLIHMNLTASLFKPLFQKPAALDQVQREGAVHASISQRAIDLIVKKLHRVQL